MWTKSNEVRFAKTPDLLFKQLPCQYVTKYDKWLLVNKRLYLRNFCEQI